MAELGVGDLAKRRDETWSHSVPVATFEDSTPDGEVDEANEIKEELDDFLQRAIDSGQLAEGDRDLLIDLAHAAEQVGAAGRRGRGGLMTPSVTRLVEEAHGMSARSVRRHAADAIRTIQEVARVSPPAI